MSSDTLKDTIVEHFTEEDTCEVGTRRSALVSGHLTQPSHQKMKRVVYSTLTFLQLQIIIIINKSLITHYS